MITLPALLDPHHFKYNDKLCLTETEFRDIQIAAARAALEAAAKEFDRREPPGTGFYLPNEPAEIIRALEIAPMDTANKEKANANR